MPDTTSIIQVAIQDVINDMFRRTELDQPTSDIVARCLRIVLNDTIASNGDPSLYQELASTHLPADTETAPNGVRVLDFQNALNTAIVANLPGDTSTNDAVALQFINASAKVTCQAECAALHTVNSGPYFVCMNTCPPATGPDDAEKSSADCGCQGTA